MSLEINIGTLLCRGRYKAVVHSGHTYDDAGNIVRMGEVKHETPFGRNLITKLGFDHMLGRTGIGSNTVMICGPSSTPVTEDDLVMGDAFGYASQFASSVLTASNANPANGPLLRTYEHRRTFPPGSLGPNAVVVAKAGIVLAPNTTPPLTSIRTSSLLTAGLLVDHLGNPTGVSVLPTDFLDIIWEYTEIVAFELSGVMPFTIDGVSVPRDYVVRPLALWATSGSRHWSGPASGQYFNFGSSLSPRSQIGTSSNGSSCVVGTNLQPVTELGDASTSQLQPSTAVPQPYVNGSKSRQFLLSWAPSQGNATPSVRRAIVTFGGSNQLGAFQVQYDPPIPKDGTRQLELMFTLSMANAP